MASNKERIETNNTRLSAISTQLDDLPPKVNLDATTITPGTENQVINAGTYLNGDLTVLGDEDLIPENILKDVNLFGVQGTRPPNYGANVWSKNIYHEAYTYTITFTCGNYSSGSGTPINFTSNGVDKITPEMLDGKTVYTRGNDYIKLEENGTAFYKYGSSTSYRYVNYTVTINTANPTIGTIWIQYQLATSTETPTSSTDVPESKETVGFIVDDDASAYPDGGEQGGYWYKLFNLSNFGIDFGEVTPAGTTSTVTVSHNLGVVPSWVALIPKIFEPVTDKTFLKFSKNGYGIAINSINHLTWSTAAETVTDTSIEFKADASYQIFATSYYWFAIA